MKDSIDSVIDDTAIARAVAPASDPDCMQMLNGVRVRTFQRQPVAGRNGVPFPVDGDGRKLMPSLFGEGGRVYSAYDLAVRNAQHADRALTASGRSGSVELDGH